MINSTIIRQNFMPKLFVKFSFFQLFSFRVVNARVFQRISMNLNVTVDQAACPLLCRYTQWTLAAPCICWIVPIVTYESGERTCDCLLHLIKA